MPRRNSDSVFTTLPWEKIVFKFIAFKIRTRRMENLSVQELETKINSLNSAVTTLRIAISEVNCEKAKTALRLQVNTYTLSLRQTLSELNKRRSLN
jgi:hypothetical protein